MNAAATLAQYAKMLRNLDRWLDMATEHAKSKGFEVDVLAASRLAPDQYELVRQVQAACDQAKFAAACDIGVVRARDPRLVVAPEDVLIACAVVPSRFPVGSSASSTRGRLTSARAMATR